MSDEKTSTLTTVLAVYGALLSSLVFGWSLYRDLADRARFKISASIRRITQDTGGRPYAVMPDLHVEPTSEQLYILLTVVNVGRRPMQWEGWGGRYSKPVNGKESFRILGKNIPKMLNENESHSEFTELGADISPAADNLKELFMWNASGKKWKLSRWQLRRLREDAQKFSSTDRANH
jgi:hypothetical protein